MKTSELIGRHLDWAVGTACGLPVEVCQIFQYGRPNGKHYISIGETDRDGSEVDFNPCEEWSQGGPLIEDHNIEIVRGNPLYFPKGNENGEHYEALWIAKMAGLSGLHPNGVHGQTPLVAAMRALVASKLGDEVEIPEELL